MVALIAGFSLRHRESRDRAIILTYELEGDEAKKYEFMCEAFRTANASAMIWRVATELAVEARRHGEQRTS